MNAEKEAKRCKSLAARARELAGKGGARIPASAGHPEGHIRPIELLKHAEKMECNAEGFERFGAQFEQKGNVHLFERIQQERRAAGIPLGQRRK